MVDTPHSWNKLQRWINNCNNYQHLIICLVCASVYAVIMNPPSAPNVSINGTDLYITWSPGEKILPYLSALYFHIQTKTSDQDWTVSIYIHAVTEFLDKLLSKSIKPFVSYLPHVHQFLRPHLINISNTCHDFKTLWTKLFFLV